MPEMKKYVVTQTREVEVSANNEVDAIALAAAAFEHGQNHDGAIARGHAPNGLWGNTNTKIVVVDIRAIDLRPRRARHEH